jgi:hypothetical protein
MTNSSYIKWNDKTFLFDCKIIKKGKDRIKKINWAKGKGAEGVFWINFDAPI